MTAEPHDLATPAGSSNRPAVARFGRRLVATPLRTHPDPPVRLALHFVWPIIFGWNAASDLVRERAGAERTADWVLAGVAVACWLLIPVRRDGRRPRPLLTTSLLLVMCVTSAVICSKAPIGIGMFTVAGLVASSELSSAGTAAVLGGGLATLGLTQLMAPAPAGTVAGVFAGSFAGLAVGITRRQAEDREHQRLALALEHERLELEQERAEVLAQRNRVAGDLHDVLAHTLGALAVQLEAADTVASAAAWNTGDTAPPEQLTALIRQSRQLVLSGLDEARRAVHTLREEPGALAERLGRLLEREPGEPPRLTVLGEVRALAPSSEEALYRAAQEGLANARKHAPGAPVSVRLEFEPSCARLLVENGPAAGGPAGGAATTGTGLALGGALAAGGRAGAPLAAVGAVAADGALAASGGGVGLAAMHERLRAAGGSLSVGPTAIGWRIEARVPAPPPGPAAVHGNASRFDNGPSSSASAEAET